VIPNDYIRREMRKAGIEDVRTRRKQVRKAAHELWREISVEE
jgi:hypothetical protein